MITRSIGRAYSAACRAVISTSGLLDRSGDTQQRAALVIILCPLRCDLQTSIALGLYAAPLVGTAPFADIIHSFISFKQLSWDNFPEGLKIAGILCASSPASDKPGKTPETGAENRSNSRAASRATAC